MKPYLLILLLSFFSCSRLPHNDKLQSMFLSEKPEQLSDELPINSFIQALKAQILYHKKLNNEVIRFGEYQVKRVDYIKSLEELVLNYKPDTSNEELLKYIDDKFYFFAVYGDRFPADILLTSYYEPLLKGSRTPTATHYRPIYRYPDDLIEIDFGSFVTDGAILGEAKRRFLIGKLASTKNIRENYVLSPYFSRAEIDEKNILQNKKLEICYLDPIDAFFLQIQGSGTIEFEENDKIRVGYAGSNGRPYHSIGKFLHDIIPAQEMSADKIESYLRSLSSLEAQTVMNQNPSYVFFREITTEPITTNNTEVVAGRTLATDPKYFSKGLIAYLYFQKPYFLDEKNEENFELSWQGRLVIDQDTGGAIKGVRRADLFWGQGAEAKKHAGVMRHEARLYYLAPKAFLIKTP
jgi:membrane-bound lytic murein transglycosylase A